MIQPRPPELQKGGGTGWGSRLYLWSEIFLSSSSVCGVAWPLCQGSAHSPWGSEHGRMAASPSLRPSVWGLSSELLIKLIHSSNIAAPIAKNQLAITPAPLETTHKQAASQTFAWKQENWGNHNRVRCKQKERCYRPLKKEEKEQGKPGELSKKGLDPEKLISAIHYKTKWPTLNTSFLVQSSHGNQLQTTTNLLQLHFCQKMHSTHSEGSEKYFTRQPLFK